MWKQDFATELQSYQPHQLLERENVRSYSVDNTVFMRLPGLYHQVSHVFYIDRLELIGARAKDGKNREPPDQPGDIVNENIFRSKDDCWPNNAVFFFQAEDGIRDGRVTGVQTCALPI